MLKVFIIVKLFVATLISLTGQSFVNFESDFTIKEKHKQAGITSLVRGSMSIDYLANLSEFKIYFPERERWVLKDSILTQYKDDSLLTSTVVGSFLENSFISDIISSSKNDYGLEDLGFVRKKIIDNNESEIEVFWDVPHMMKDILSGASTFLKENLLTRVVFYDINNTIIISTFFEDYIFLKGKPISSKISSKIVGENEIIFRSIEFDNIKSTL